MTIPKYFLGLQYGTRSDPVTFDLFFPEEEERPFVDRDEFIKAFKDALGSIREKERSVLVYHGVGGIGKTSLRKELPKVIEKHNESHINLQILWAAVDFETEEFRQSHKFLEILRDQFQGKYRMIKFHTFDIAHAIYWTKVNPRIPLHRENYSEDSNSRFEQKHMWKAVKFYNIS